MKKIVIISTDTPHHRYLINSLVEKSISLSACIFETKKLITKFPTKHSFEKDQALFEEGVFFSKLPNELSCNNVVTFDTVNSSNSQRYLNDLKPDLGIVFGTGKIDNNIIRIFKHGLINVHRGMIEKYRGLDSDLWAIYHDDYENIGVTIHMVDEGLDTGDIIYQETLTLHGCESIEEWFSKLSVDIALIDGTFWSLDEIPNRAAEEIPHPTVEETLQRLDDKKIHDVRIIFFHLNHHLHHHLHLLFQLNHISLLHKHLVLFHQGLFLYPSLQVAL